MWLQKVGHDSATEQQGTVLELGQCYLPHGVSLFFNFGHFQICINKVGPSHSQFENRVNIQYIVRLHKNFGRHFERAKRSLGQCLF